MARMFTMEANRTYANEANAVKAVEKKFPEADNDGLRYFIQWTPEGRCFPVFVGEKALQRGVHFHFQVTF